MSDANRTQALTADPNRTQMGAPPSLDPNRTMMGTAPSLDATVTIKPVQCPVCKTFNPAGVPYCVDCGLIFDRALDGDAFGAPAVQLPMLVDGTGREQPVRPGENTIGREGDVVVADGRVSRRHARITSAHDQLVLEDLGSTNGTKVDGQPLAAGEKRVLKGTETLSFGGVELRLALPGAVGGNATQAIAGGRTAALPSAPQREVAPARLVGGGHDFALHAGVNGFGRRAENDVVIPDAYVSGRHGQIEVTEDGLFITDLGSSNGTLLNDARLGPNMRTRVTTDDVIRLGSLELRLVLADGS